MVADPRPAAHPRPTQRTYRLGPVEAGSASRIVSPPAPIGDKSPTISSVPEWRQYELDKGSQQTIVRTIFEGRDITVRLDFPPDMDGIVDLRKFNWWKPGYMKPFLQGKVTKSFQMQIQKYR